MKNITLIRHGEVEARYQGAYNGWIDIDLSPKGAQDMKILGLSFSESDAIYCSDLKRCQNSLSFFKTKKQIISKELREKSWGENEGKTFDEIGIEYETFMQYIYALGGETLNIFEMRVKKIWEEIKSSEHKNITVLTHGGLIRMIYCLERDIDYEESFNIDVGFGSLHHFNFEGS